MIKPSRRPTMNTNTRRLIVDNVTQIPWNEIAYCIPAVLRQVDDLEEGETMRLLDQGLVVRVTRSHYQTAISFLREEK
jgi:hypothetical protein